MNGRLVEADMCILAFVEGCVDGGRRGYKGRGGHSPCRMIINLRKSIVWLDLPGGVVIAGPAHGW